MAPVLPTKSRERLSPIIMKRRIASMSEVTLEKTLPVCSLSWKAKLRCCSLSYIWLRRLKQTIWERESER